MSQYCLRGGSVVSCERVLEGVEVSFLKCREELVTEGSADIMTIVVLSTLVCVLEDERLLVEEVCLRRYGGSTAGGGWSDEVDLTD